MAAVAALGSVLAALYLGIWADNIRRERRLRREIHGRTMGGR